MTGKTEATVEKAYTKAEGKRQVSVGFASRFHQGKRSCPALFPSSLVHQLSLSMLLRLLQPRFPVEGLKHFILESEMTKYRRGKDARTQAPESRRGREGLREERKHKLGHEKRIGNKWIEKWKERQRSREAGKRSLGLSFHEGSYSQSFPAIHPRMA